MSKNTLTKVFFPALAFLISFSAYFFTRSASLGFSDAAEFALVTKLGSIAHGPGFPAYVFLGWVWAGMLSVLGANHYFSIQLFSIIAASAAGVVLYFTTYNLSRKISAEQGEIYSGFVALVTALAFSCGFTMWYWSNNIEVYAFHVLAFSVLVYGALQYNQARSNRSIYITAVGLALGLSNHHLTVILFLPFLLLFTGGNMFASEPVGDKKGKKPKPKKGSLVVEFITSKQFAWFAGITTAITVFFYGWMMYRAGLDMPFKFGRPDNLHRLYQHLTGAAWQTAVAAKVEGIIGMRAPYFGWLLVRQYGLFLIFILAGAIWLARGRRFAFMAVVVGYFLLLTAYQLRLNQVGDSDAYMLLPYYMLALFIPFGFKQLAAWKEQSLVAAGVFAA
ncbi:MAG TPA: DUF2723 domain-containing protein, partial [Chitinophagales bacterium]|nr:DUF2723 domain-containing protein [Chitinophagales bacterium]